MNFIEEDNIIIDVSNSELNLKDSSRFYALTLNYELNYNYKTLVNILEYYGIKKSRLNKKEIIEKIVNFEIDDKNILIVAERERLFDNFIELKNNKFFSKFILSEI